MKQCTLRIKDEVNCKFEGLDPLTRRKLVNEVSYFLQSARHTPAWKLGRWDGKVNLCNIGGSTYVGLLDRLLPIVIADGYDINMVDERIDFGVNFDPVDNDSYSHIKWKEHHPMEYQSIKLYDHQVEFINSCLANPQCVYICPTAGGKTISTAILADKISQYGGSITIVPTRDLVDQTAEEFENMGMDVGKFYGKEKTVEATHIIATWQSMESARKNQKTMNGKITLKQLVEGRAGVIVDETHKAKGSVLRELLGGELSHLPIRWGLTGTLPDEELDCEILKSVVGPTSGMINARDLQDAGVLSNLHINVNQINDDNLVYGDYHSEHTYLVTDKVRLENIVHKIITPALKKGNTLIIVDRVATGEILNELIPGSVFVSGQTKKEDRKEAYDLAKTRDDVIVIATSGVASTGISINRMFLLVMFELGKAYIKVIQTIGRGLRIAKDKDFVDVIDITSTMKFSKKHMAVRKKHYKKHGYPFSVKKLSIKD